MVEDPKKGPAGLVLGSQRIQEQELATSNDRRLERLARANLEHMIFRRHD